ncbi:hypothetical protein C5167_033244 [Papaver somniferum]|uniref:Peptidase M3A/M3B catalytic domain-containing protein n=1 Tax=Papaver somniferum TaxID=3469 RepID=A0A4Y7KBC9_PAPSO|nr:hypothetical protein C5167_033244 [Papaver somniferum]
MEDVNEKVANLDVTNKKEKKTPKVNYWWWKQRRGQRWWLKKGGVSNGSTTAEEWPLCRIVEWDAVELPSQFMENWCLQRDSLVSLVKHYETGEMLPEEIPFASTDLELHGSYIPGGSESIFDIDRRVGEKTELLHQCQRIVSIKKNTRRRRYMYMNGDCFVSKTFLRAGFDENAGAIDHEVRGSLALPIINPEDQSCRGVLELVTVKEKPNLILSLIMFVALFRKLDKLSPEPALSPEDKRCYIWAAKKALPRLS